MLNKEFPKPQRSLLANRTRETFLFGPFRLDASERVLLRDGEPVALTPKAFDTLLVLVSYGGRLVEKDRLLEEVWPDTFVEEKTLAQNVLTIRKALGRTPAGTHYVETVPKHGYRFAAEVRVAEPTAPGFRPDASGFVATRSRTELVVEEEYEIDDSHADAAIVQDQTGPARPTHIDATTRALAGETRQRAATPATSDALAARATAEAAEIAATQTSTGTTQTSTDSTQTATSAATASAATDAPAARRKLVVAAVVVAACALVAAGALLARRAWRGAGEPFRDFQVTRLTTTGDVSTLAISPDGRFVAYGSLEGGRARLLVRQVDGTATVEVVPPAEVRFVGVAFAHDGSRLYYVTRRMGDAGIYGDLYSVPVFGGAATQLVHDVDSPVAVAADGRLAFVRVSADQKETAIVVTDARGANERRLAVRPMREGFSLAGPAWSPDGQLIACASNADQTAKWSARLLLVNAADGSVAPFSQRRWSWIGRAVWAADGRGLFLVAWDSESATMSDQVWYVSYPGDAARRVTNDVSGFLGASLSADGRSLLAARSERVAGFYVAPVTGATAAQKLGGVSADLFGDRYGFSWTPDGRVVYASAASGEPNLWIMDGDGANRRQLTSEHGGNVEPAVAPDGRTIVFVSYRTGERHLWRVRLDGGEPRQLTAGEGDDAPAFTPDGRWVVYSSYVAGQPALWKVPAEGGTPQRITEFVADMPAVSPDGKLVACYHFNDPLARPRLALVSLADGKIVREFDPPNLVHQIGVRWTPDGAGLVYLAAGAGVGNLRLQPVDGRAARALTDFNSDRIFRFDLSRDGRLIYERGTTVNDAILLRSK